MNLLFFSLNDSYEINSYIEKEFILKKIPLYQK